jgi:hypothetical protein
MARLMVFVVLGLLSWLGSAFAQAPGNGVAVSMTGASAPPAVVNIWPQIPFTRAKDLCQYHDAYGRTKSEQMGELTQTVRSLLREGVDSRNLVALLNVMDTQVNQQRKVAGSSPGMDVLLAGSLKAAVDKVYQDRRPQSRRFNFFNAAPLNELLRQLRDPQKQAVWDPQVMRALSGVAYGTYAYAPTCRGDLVVTLHIDLSCGNTYHFQAQGFPEQVMQSMGQQVFETFQQTEEEYEYLSNLGDWNGGVTCSRAKLWAMASNMVMAPDLPNPSPVRSVSEFPGQDFNYYCVR